MLEIVEQLEFKHVYPYDALLWITNANVSQTEGFDGWHISFKLNDGGIVNASSTSVFKAIQLLTSELFYEFIREKKNIVRQSKYAEKEFIAYHTGIVKGLKLAMEIEYTDRIWILAARIYENMTGIDRGEL